jgi:UDPglucose--hexose-1-phosphate uridylyltransferase
MPEIRKNRVTGEFVIMAPERAKRPSDLNGPKPEAKALPEHSHTCPLCAGNEAMTPPETYRIPDPANGSWLVRCVPNKFSALSPEGELSWKTEGLRISMNGVGLHDVIVDSPRHDLCIALMQENENLIRTYHSRFTSFHEDPRVEQVIIFKNHGPAAGTSLEHPHSQIVGMPIVPVQIRYRSEEARRFYMDHGSCLLCRTLAEELSDASRVIVDSKSFTAFIPYASLSPFHIWIFPKRHSGCFGDTTPEELDELAVVLKTVLYKLYKGISNPDFFSAGRRHRQQFVRHLLVRGVPRLTKTAGSSLGPACG